MCLRRAVVCVAFACVHVLKCLSAMESGHVLLWYVVVYADKYSCECFQCRLNHMHLQSCTCMCK